MKTRIHSFQWYKATLSLALVLLHPTANAQTWQRNTDIKNQSPLQWNLVNQDTGSKNKSRSGSVSFPQWKAVEPAEIIHAETEIKNSDSEKIIVYMPSGTTFANDKAIWRDNQWHPQISNTVPIGFGPKGIMATMGLSGIDCTASGVCVQPDTFDDYRHQLEEFGEAQADIALGFGDAEKLFGISLTGAFEETNLPLGDRNTNEEKNILSNYYVGIDLSRNIGPDTAVRVGVKNWIDVKECGLSCGFPKSGYGVISQRFRLNPDQNSWFPNAYLTAGMGNGEFRPLEEQVRSSIAAQRSAGCSTYGYLADKPCNSDTLRRAVLDAANYGQLTPIGAAAIEVYPGFNAIGEWSGRNLNLGFSVRPFEDFGLVFTSMWNNLLQNCDYGCKVDVPDYPEGAPIPDNMTTERAVWSFRLSLDMKF
jgi:hypothetical protein|tara:strand:- start:187 stop:1449 length:1263 start_codon:yes stop_codon:yes gene_type:complete